MRGKEDRWLRSLRCKNDEKLLCRVTTRFENLNFEILRPTRR